MKIVLACNAGMSTSILKMKLEEEMKKDNLEPYVIAVPVSEIDDYIEGADIVLLGPQIRFLLKEVKTKTNVPVITIDIRDYGTMNAVNVYSLIKRELNKE